MLLPGRQRTVTGTGADSYAQRGRPPGRGRTRLRAAPQDFFARFFLWLEQGEPEHLVADFDGLEKERGQPFYLFR